MPVNVSVMLSPSIKPTDLLGVIVTPVEAETGAATEIGATTTSAPSRERRYGRKVFMMIPLLLSS
jgi:hypothetical protein